MSIVDMFPILFDGYYIKIIFLFHFFTSSLLAVSTNSQGLMSYNLVFLFLLGLSIADSQNPEIILIATVTNALCIVLDFLNLIYISSPFLIILIIICGILRVPSSLFLLKNYSVRAGVEDPINGLIGPPSSQMARSAYQDIEGRGLSA